MQHRYPLFFAICLTCLVTLNLSAQPLRLYSSSIERDGWSHAEYWFDTQDTCNYFYNHNGHYNTKQKKWLYDNRIDWYYEYPDYVTALKISADTNIFDVNGNIVTSYLTHLWNGNYDTFRWVDCGYDTANNLISKYVECRLDYDSTKRDKFYRFAGEYDTQNRLIWDAQERWIYGSNCFNYDSSINTYKNDTLISRINYYYTCYLFGQMDITKYSYKYNNGRLDTMLREFVEPIIGNTSPFRMTCYNYNSQGDCDTAIMYEWDYLGSGPLWTPIYKDIYNYDNNHNQTRWWRQNHWQGVYTDHTKDSTVYNSQNLPEIYFKYIWWDYDSLKWTMRRAEIHRYYYGPPSSIQEAQSPIGSGQLKLYPNPASTVLKVSFENKTESPVVNFGIYDVTGKCMRHWIEPALSTHAIDVSNLPPGNYILNVNNIPGLFESFIVTR